MIINKSPLTIIDHLRNNLYPFSFETLNSSKSEEPTKAPENEFESGAIKNPINIRKTDIDNNIIIKIVAVIKSLIFLLII